MPKSKQEVILSEVSDHEDTQEKVATRYKLYELVMSIILFSSHL